MDFGEFRSAVRKGAQVTIAMMSDSELRKIFYAVDANDDGDVSLDELTSFIWPGDPDHDGGGGDDEDESSPRDTLLGLSGGSDGLQYLCAERCSPEGRREGEQSRAEKRRRGRR